MRTERHTHLAALIGQFNWQVGAAIERVALDLFAASIWRLEFRCAILSLLASLFSAASLRVRLLPLLLRPTFFSRQLLADQLEQTEAAFPFLLSRGE